MRFEKIVHQGQYHTCLSGQMGLLSDGRPFKNTMSNYLDTVLKRISKRLQLLHGILHRNLIGSSSEIAHVVSTTKREEYIKDTSTKDSAYSLLQVNI